jgi:hypothetical protein
MICEKHKFYQELGFCPSCKFEFNFIHPKLYQISDLASRIIDIFEEIEDEIDYQRLEGLEYNPSEIDKLFNIEINGKKLTINDFKQYLEALQNNLEENL